MIQDMRNMNMSNYSYRTIFQKVMYKTNLRLAMSLLLMMVLGVNTTWGQTTYTFYVINNNGKQSVKATTASVESTSTVLDAFKATTTSVLSPLIALDTDYYFYDTEAEATAATGFTSGGGNGSSTIATVDADNDKNIYVRYYYNNDSSPIDLSGSIQYNIMIGGRYLVFNQSRTQRPETIQEGAVTGEMLQSTSVTNVTINGRAQNIYFRWKFTGNDPYNITVATCYDPGDKFLWGKMGSTGSATTMWVNNGFTGDALLGDIQSTNIYKNAKNETNLASFILLPHSSGTDFVLMAATTLYQPNNSSQYAYQRNASTATPNKDAHYQAPYFLFSTVVNAQAVSITPIGNCESPTITYDNATGKVTLESETSGATIYYTVDGTTEPSSSATRYTAPFSISGTTTIKAIAIRTGVNNSEVVTQTIEKMVSPSVSFDDATQKVSITTNSEVEGATNVYTTDGNNPTPSSTEYSEGISLTETSTVKAMTVKDGYINSDVVSLPVEKLASLPTITISGSTVTLSYDDLDANIYYVTDGTTPTQESTLYSTPFTLDGNQKFTIKATATKAGFLNSDVAQEVIDNRTTISVPTITYTNNVVTITASDIGDEIYYTTDGSTPTTNTATHFTSSGTFDLVYGSSYTIRAIVSNGRISSSVATETINLTDVGYAGIYYIRNIGNDGVYYMYPVGENTLVKTAKKTDQDAIWKIEIVGDYYRIIHYKDGKYLVAAAVENNIMPDAETVSLVDTDSPGENALFEITRKSGDESNIMNQIILIRPKAAVKDVVNTESGHIYLNTRGGNNGSNVIGLYDETGSSEWQLATVPAKPTISVNDIKVTISSDLDNVYYTIDGTTPTSSSASGKSVTLKYGPSYTVKAICIYHDDISNEDWTSEVATSSKIQVNLLNPIISRSGSNVTITNSQKNGVTFRYTFSDDGTDPANPAPGGDGTNYSSALPITAGARNVFKAIAYNIVNETTYKSGVVTFVVDLRSATTISSLADITSSVGNYILGAGFTATGTPEEGGVEIGTSTNPFKGTIDGNLVEFELSSPLFDYVQDAIIKNVIISKATISTNGNAGAIANNASGASRIYNCGVLANGSTVATDDDGYTSITSCTSTISGSSSGCVGGIVGLLDGSSRVINCFSYANITGGDKVGGIVGKNNVTTNANNLKTMVMNCMFYGNITGGTSKAPIYNGTNIVNKDANGVSNFNYFLADATFTGGINVYNCALMAEKRYLQRFEFFRHLLNSHRELAAWWATGEYSNKDEMAKWVMEPSQIGSATPFPVLKAPKDANGKYIQYPSVVNIDAKNATTQSERNKGGKLGTLTVNIQMGDGAVYNRPSEAQITTEQLTLNITDKDPDHFNFNYYKVQLPYYNDVGTKNYTGNRVVTGWKIVNISGGTTSFTTGSDAATNASGEITSAPYNFADRNCTEKDLYSKSGRVFNQGAYFDVPEGVTSITIQPYWAKCVYLADANADKVYDQAMTTGYNVPNVGGGTIYTNGKNYSIAGDNQLVYTTMSNAISSTNSTGLFVGVEGDPNNHTVYDYAVVLVGNYHNYNSIESSSSKPYTVTSIDLDGDNEPDYSYILRFDARKGVHPVKVDFLNVPGLGMAQKSTGSTGTYNFGIMQPLSWFEVTNTALFRVTQFEYEHQNRAAKPLILHGGVIEQWVSGQSGGNGQQTTYIHVGSNVWFKEFHLGCHQDATLVTKHPPVSVTGGDYNEFYLTGLYSAAGNCNDNAECYINGGRFDKVAGTGIEGIGDASTHENGNIVWQIQNADIEEFYGGGINATKPIEGSITTVITGSHVKRFCGGPKFGDLNENRTVITTATDCTFGSFFGAGYGGNSYNRVAPGNFTNQSNYEWNQWIAGTTKGNVAPIGGSTGNYPGNITYNGYKQDYISAFGGVSTRFDYQFLPQSDNVHNVARLFIDFVSFSLATTHDVTSKLTGCTITGNFYGGGSLGKVEGNVTSTLTDCMVRGSVFGGGYDATLPKVEVMSTAGFTTPPNYNENTGVFFPAAEPYNTSIEYTWEYRETVNNTETAINKTDHILYTTADLTTLGTVTGKATLNIEGTTTVGGSVYGGGEESNVSGNTEVTMSGGTITHNVYGGGKGVADNFLCDKAMVGGNDDGKCDNPGSEENKDKGTKVIISNGTVNGNVYGGGEVGRVEWNTQVKIGFGTGDGPFAPVINGSVFGAGAGKETHGYSALVRGNSTVIIQGDAKVLQNVYGGGEKATVGRYWVKGIPTIPCEGETQPTPPSTLPDEMPYKTRRGGKSTVVVQGNAQVGPDDGATTTAGHVFGAGKGVTPNYVHTGEKANWSRRMVDYNSQKHATGEHETWDYYEEYTDAQKADVNFPKYVWEYFATDDKYFEFLQTLALVTGTDVTVGGGTVKGNVYGGSESGFVQDDTNVRIQGATTNGNVFGGGKGLSSFAEAGKVKGTTTVAINAGDVYGNVYGGGELGDVGLITKPADYNYTWQQSDGTTNNTPRNNAIPGTNNNTGICTVTISGGTIGTSGTVSSEHGNVFGAGKGEGTTFWCEKAIAYATNVSVSGGTVNGNVYGGGQIGRVEDDAKVTIAGGTADATGADIKGSVFGAGAGLATHGYSALVRGDTKVTIEGYAKVAKSVYGGGETASVGRYGLNAQKMPNILVGGGKCELKVQGNAEIGEDVFGACKGVTPAYNNTQGADNRSKRMVTYDPGREVDPHVPGTENSFWNYYDDEHRFVWEYFTTPEAYSQYLETLALATHPEVTIDGSATVGRSVFGGGELGLTKGSVIVTIQGGTIEEDVYGGGALADTNTTEKVANNYPTTTPETDDDGNIVTRDVYPTTTVNLLGGIIKGDAYGGGLGQLGDNPVPATVHGNISVNLGSSAEGSSATGFYITNYTGDHSDVIKSGRIFGCNNLNGSPQGDVRVTVWKTVEGNSGRTTEANLKNANATHSYNVAAVYGGGNLANYTTVGKKAYVRIETCDVSIESVYGGGNAAEVPETNVLVRGAYEINEVFGGGNGKDPYTLNGTDWIDNSGANIGNSDTPGNATTLLTGGLVHGAYGGSNKRGTIFGNVSIDTGTGSEADNSTNAGCNLDVEKLVGAGKDADVNGDLIMVMGCKPDEKIPVVYAGADNAHVNGDVMLTITSGKFGKVFGGNNAGGYILGRIRLNIEETADCDPAVPIEIDELYLGGNEAEYSMYGYYLDGTDYKPRTAAMAAITDPSASGYTPAVTTMAGMEVRKTVPYANPELNIISCTRIDKVYGGGFGDGATIYGDPIVNINMIPGRYYNDASKGVPAKMTALGLPPSDNSDKLGIIGDVFGGGNAAKIEGSTTVNIGTETTVNLTSILDDETTSNVDESLANVKGAYIVGNVYGGGNEADVTGNTEVNVGTGTYTGEGFEGVNIRCLTSDKLNTGMVFGGGNAADVTGNTVVNMAGGYVENRIYGGGNLGNVGNITERETPTGHSHTGTCIQKPKTWAANTGKCTVTVSGGQVGPTGMTMPQDFGYVFGAGRGETKDPEEDHDIEFRAYVYDTEVIIRNLYEDGHEGDADHITSKPLICGGVYGGSENGRVRQDTHVKIQGGQIGCGAGKTAAYAENLFIDPATATVAQINASASAMTECASWMYNKNTALPYDAHAGESGYNENTYGKASTIGTDGHTFYGNVFGGGSGYWSYQKADGSYEWLSSAGMVEGDTHVTISGGHILTCVYGGNEMTNVGGTCNVTMTGGTLGVPRTLTDIAAHPVTCYLFGAGKGDQRIHFNQSTNVGAVNVSISGGIIYGSVFGGGEDGHVLGDVTMTISGTAKIGTWGTSYVDGNVFGGGRGFGGDAYTAGNVAGSVNMNISGGTMLGSIYGGGRLGSVGYGLYEATETEDATGHKMYGEMQDDGYGDWYKNSSDEYVRDAIDGFKRGYVEINITGGTIGNDLEYMNVPENILPADLEDWKSTNHIPNTDIELYKTVKEEGQADQYFYRLKHTKGGNVFTGGMGRLYQLDGQTPISSIDWWRLGNVKSTKLTITGGTIKSCVYGGGELGAVAPSGSGESAQGGTTDISIKGNSTIIGTEVKNGNGVTQYTFGSVFGGGFGSTIEYLGDSDDPDTDNDNPKFIAGLVHGDTKIQMEDGSVLASVYGGGEVASVKGSTDVAVKGGEVGMSGFGGATMGNVYGGGSGNPNIVRCGKIYKNTKVTISGTDTKTKIYHNVYGGGAYGTVGDFKYNKDVNTQKVIGINSLISGGEAEVIITGGTIGVDGNENGMVFGSSRGDINKPEERDDYTAWVYNTNVTIGNTDGGPTIKGSVYGSGENGHTFNNTVVTVKNGTIGIPSGADITYTENGQSVTKGGAAYPYRGNVYGGGCGTDMYASNNDGVLDSYNPLAGIVYGNTTVTINGGTVVRNVYGAGAMGSVGKAGDSGVITSGGTTNITIDGGTIGVSGIEGAGNVFGAARGNATSTQTNVALVRTTGVTIGKPDGTGPTVFGNVYGGAESGFVQQDTDVKIKGGTIGTEADTDGNIFGGGLGVLKNEYAGRVSGNTAVTVMGATINGSVYGGGALGKSNTAVDNGIYPTATVNLLGGTITGDAFGGGLGNADTNKETFADVGNTEVNLNEGVAIDAKGCIVKGYIFGANNVNGTPLGHAKVHVFATQNESLNHIEDKLTITSTEPTEDDFDVKGVFGGGKSSDYVPASTDAKQSTEVIIDGCNLTSIYEVYGGGYGAAVPGTNVTINGTKIIDKLFGGGYGASDPGIGYVNPGANVGYRTNGVPYGLHCVENDKTKIAIIQLKAGKVNSVFGGSNTLGEIRNGTSITTVTTDDTGATTNPCDILEVGELYGGGNEAPMEEGGAEIVLRCMPDSWIGEVYAGARNANVGNDVGLTITSGKFERVFGGNKSGGAIDGYVEVNIEECPTCNTPVIIGELYGGGNQADYVLSPQYGADYQSPRVNVRAFTSIGTIYGGGKDADVKGNPTVNINVGMVDGGGQNYAGETKTIDNRAVQIYGHEEDKIGVIGNVYGGGNAAKVNGNTTVNIGTESYVKLDRVIAGETCVYNYYTRKIEGNNYVYELVPKDKAIAADDVTYYKRKKNGTFEEVEVTVGVTDVSSYYTCSDDVYTPVCVAQEGVVYYIPVIGADIRGNVYGGGEGTNAVVTGNTNVVIGKKAE